MDTKATIALARSPSPVPAGAPAESQELRLAAQVQRTMLPPRAFVGDRTFYATLWKPKDAVSGDFYEALPIAGGDWLYVLGDVQGHGTVAAMAMMAVQGFLRQLSRLDDLRELGPADVANALQGFVASNLGAVSYLTALVCFHRPAEGVVDWISCGAPDPAVVDPDDPAPRDINPEKRGGLPVGMGMAGLAWITRGLLPPGRIAQRDERHCLRPAKAAPPAPRPESGPLDLGIDSDLYLANLSYRDGTPSHISIPDPSPCRDCIARYGAPCTRFCPAAVYERAPDGAPADAPPIRIRHENCLQCRTCTLKCPSDAIRWTTPVHGNGPDFRGL